MDRNVVLTDFARVINSDRYQYTESDVFLMEGMEKREAVFDMFFRKTEDGGFAVVSGIQEVISLIDILNSTSSEEKRRYFSQIIKEKHLLEYLVEMKFTGEIYAMRDGEIAYIAFRTPERVEVDRLCPAAEGSHGGSLTEGR